MKVKKQNLLLIACFVWLFAGFNILNIGISTYIKNINYINIININLSLLVFLLFWILTFSKLVVRHTNRIKNFNEEFLFFLNFFDKKSFIIMFCMMSFGIIIRKFHLVSNVFISVFYTGLGLALFFAGISFGYNYINFFTNKFLYKGGKFMKKLINISFIYFIFAMVCGVFYREFTKFFNFTEKTALALTHLHLIALGTILFLILSLFAINTNLLQQSKFKYFLKLYNISLPFMVIMFIIRGVLQVLNTNLSATINASISGISGISHILMLVSFILLFLSLKNINFKQK